MCASASESSAEKTTLADLFLGGPARMGEEGNAYQTGIVSGGTNRPNSSSNDPGGPEKQNDRRKGSGASKSSHGATTASKTPWLMAPGRFDFSSVLGYVFILGQIYHIVYQHE
jgi:hypothetical protein